MTDPALPFKGRPGLIRETKRVNFGPFMVGITNPWIYLLSDGLLFKWHEPKHFTLDRGWVKEPPKWIKAAQGDQAHMDQFLSKARLVPNPEEDQD